MTQNARKRWTQEERDYVNDSWGNISVNRIAKHLGRTPYAIVRYAEKNKLGGAVFTEQYLTTTNVANLVGVNPTTVISWVKTKLLKARTNTLKQRRVYLIDPFDLVEFLKENPNRWKATNIDRSLVNEDEEWFKEKLASDSNPIENSRGRLWTIKEEKTLLTYIIQGKTSEEIAKLMQRTFASVKRKRNRIGDRVRNMKVVLICGKASSGKSTFAQFLKENFDLDNRAMYFDRTLIRHNAQSVKDKATKDFKWNGVKDYKGRQLLLDLTEDGYAKDQFYWEKETFTEAIMYKEFTNKNCNILIIPDWRYPSTKDYFEKVADEVVTIRIENPNLEKGTHDDHVSETMFKNFDVDYTIYNSTDLTNLRKMAKEIVRRCNY